MLKLWRLHRDRSWKARSETERFGASHEDTWFLCAIHVDSVPLCHAGRFIDKRLQLMLQFMLFEKILFLLKVIGFSGETIEIYQ